jgi:hypothetical protein
MKAVNVSEAVPPPAAPALPPYNGFGSHEDSAQNCLRLVPAAPKKSLSQFVQKERIVLRFGCTFVPSEAYAMSPSDRHASGVCLSPCPCIPCPSEAYAMSPSDRHASGVRLSSCPCIPRPPIILPAAGRRSGRMFFAPQGAQVCVVVLYGRRHAVHLRAATAEQRRRGRQVSGAHARLQAQLDGGHQRTGVRTPHPLMASGITPCSKTNTASSPPAFETHRFGC